LKISQYENPLTGKKGNLFDIGGLWQMVLGVFVLFFIWAMGQNLSKAVSGKVPFLDTTPDQPWANPTAPQQSIRVL
jgi:hypothetical protein